MSNRTSNLWTAVLLVLLAACLMVVSAAIVRSQVNGAAARPKGLADTSIVADTSDDQLPSDSWKKVDSMPVPTNQVNPEYPESEKKAGVEGKVWVSMLINKQGLVRKVKVAKREKASIVLEEAAVAACRQWRFVPAKMEGQPVAVWVTVDVVFTIGEKDQPSKK